MVPLFVKFSAGFDIFQRIASGELEVAGILLRDKKPRYILQGLQDLPADPVKVANLPSLEPLRSALSTTQLLQVITVAQNAAIAASLRRIEASLERIGQQLDGIETRLTQIETSQTLLLAAMRESPVSRLESAKSAAVAALQRGDHTALNSAGRQAEQAARDLLAQATHLVRIKENGIPAALLAPSELTHLSYSAVDASRTASAIWLALDAKEPARVLMKKTADGLEAMRPQLAVALQDPELAMRRVAAKLGTDEELATAGRHLQTALYQARGREMMIKEGMIVSDPQRRELEVSTPVPVGLGFVPLAD